VLAQTPAPPATGDRTVVIPNTSVSDRLAVPDCVPRASDEAAREACRTVTEVLKKDLRFEGLPIVPENLYGMLPALKPDAPNFEDWKSIGAQILVITQADVTAGVLNLEVRVHHVASAQSMLARKFSNKADNPRYVAHQAADEILALAQIRGIARSKIAFVSDRDQAKGKVAKEIYIMDYDGANPRRVTVNRSINMLPSWSPDGKSVAYISYRNIMPELFTAWIYEGRSSGFAAGKGGKIYAHAFSPDGKRIAYAYSPAAGRGGGSDMDLYVANADGTQPQRLTNTAAADTAPTWSPTGREIAFTRSLVIGQPQIYVMDSEGLNTRRVSTIGTYNDGPSWNPAKEFTEIAYTSRIDGRFEVAVVDLANGQTRQITQGRGNCEAPSWAPNGRHLVFCCENRGRWQIAISDRNGRDLQFLPSGPGNNIYPDWGPAAAQ